METGTWPDPRVIRKTAAAIATAFILLYCAIAEVRIAYPFQLEYTESGMLDHVARCLHGQPLYCAPSIEYVPFIYPPLYYYVSAGAAAVAGEGFIPLRLVSFLSSIALFAALVFAVRNLTGRFTAGLLAAGIFAAAYRAGGAWLDIARVDSLFLALWFWGFALLTGPRSFLQSGAAGLLFALALLTKQSALVMTLPVLAVAVKESPRHGWAAVAAFIVPALAADVLLNITSHGWYHYYIWQLPAGHELLPKELLLFWTRDIIRPFGIGILLVIAFMTIFRAWRNVLSLEFAALAGSLAAAWFSRMHSGGYDNVLLPAYAAIALTAARAFDSLLDSEPGGSRWTRYLRPGLAALLALQFAVLLYNPAKQVPTTEDRKAGEMFVSLAKNARGDVYIPYHTEIARLAGKPPYAHGMAVYDVVRGDKAGGWLLTRQLNTAFTAHRFGIVLLDFRWEWTTLEQAYEWGDLRHADTTLFMPVTGTQVRPHLLYYPPRKDTPGED